MIKSSSNKFFKFFKSLLSKKNRNIENLFLVEGKKVILESLTYTRPEYVAMSETFYSDNKNKELVTKISSLCSTYIFTETIFNKLSSTENSQGIIGYYKQLHKTNLKQIKTGRYILLDDVKDPGNAGGIIRSADAFSIDGVILTKECVDLYNPKLIRSTMASIFRVDIYILEEKADIASLKDNDFKIVSTSIGNAASSYKYKFNGNLVIVMGNEAKGISDEMLSYSQEKIYIPMNDGIDSLNVNVASSIIMYEMNRDEKANC
ncbi:TrmH family RNA methyltransferase [Anaerosphaera multitolerans]|uniref:TrmH family RNA methyltransferase n=1 Tax=Anaerosphaera multitolerans TaxID=2487351 RepID=UPI003B84ABDA